MLKRNENQPIRPSSVQAKILLITIATFSFASLGCDDFDVDKILKDKDDTITAPDTLFDANTDSDTDQFNDIDSGPDPDSHSDSDIDSDADTDTDTDMDTDTDADTDTSLDIDADTDSDTDTDLDTDSDTVADTDTEQNADAGSKDAGSNAGCLIISEYIEGSGWNKGIEIYNCGQELLDLTDYSICLISNDKTTCSSTFNLSGQLESGSVTTICHTSSELIDNCDFLSGVCAFTGDDRLAIKRSQHAVDAFGQTAVRPEGTRWKDITLRRCDFESFIGDEVFDYSLYYTAHEQNDFQDFGIPPSQSSCPVGGDL